MYTRILQPLAVMALIDTVNSAVTHQISVGARGAFKFDPADLTAAVGDTLEFRFYNPSGPHNVVSGDFSSPCTPNANAFFSGDMEGDSNGNQAFLVQVTSTEPLYFYCSEARHCQNGMAGAVNAPAGQGSTAYIQGARRVPQAEEPSDVTGGTVTSLGGATASASSPASSPASSSSRASSAAVSTSSTENSSMSSANVVSTSTSTSTATSTATSTVAGSGSSSGGATGAGVVVTSASGTIGANTGTATTSPSATTTPNVGSGRQSQGIVLGVLAAVLGGFVALMA